MKNIINKVIGKIAGKSRKFFPVVDEHGRFEVVEKPRKFFPVVDEHGRFEVVEKSRKIGFLITGNKTVTNY